MAGEKAGDAEPKTELAVNLFLKKNPPVRDELLIIGRLTLRYRCLIPMWMRSRTSTTFRGRQPRRPFT